MSTHATVGVDEIDYPTRDGRLIGETPIHRDNLAESLWTLQRWYQEQSRDQTYVSGNMFVYYVKGDPARRVAPDFFVVNGVPNSIRDCYQVWKERRQTLDLVIEFTSRKTRNEDIVVKFELYRDQLGVKEYLLFDPRAEYLEPPQQLFRLRGNKYEPVETVEGRLPSAVLGLHFDRQDWLLRFWQPESRKWLRTTKEIMAETRRLRAECDALREENNRLRTEIEAHSRTGFDSDPNGGEPTP